MPTAILTPLPQYSLGQGAGSFEPVPGFRLSVLPPAVRAAMLRAVPASNEAAEAKAVVVQSDVLAIADVPSEVPEESAPIAGALYRAVADRILRRVVDCLRLWEDVPDPYLQSCWFVGEYEEDPLKPSNLNVLDANWQSSQEHEGSFCLANTAQQSRSLWPLFREFVGIDGLIKAFTAKKKQNGYVSAGNARVKELAKRMAEAAATESKSESAAAPKQYKIPQSFSAKWFIEGYMLAYLKAVRSLDESLYTKPSRRRFTRAFQAFAGSFGLDNPFRYVARMTCIESLLGLETSELGYQLKTRAAWILHPDSLQERVSFSKKLGKCYSLRSKIVHGGRYSLGELASQDGELLSIARSIIQAILLDEQLRDIYLEGNNDECDAFLSRLALGADTSS